MKIVTKDPDAVLDYKVDWSTWLAEISDTIATSSWDVPTGLTEDSDENNETEAVVWLSGGTAGQTYTVTNHIVTAGGREDDRSFQIVVKDR